MFDINLHHRVCFRVRTGHNLKDTLAIGVRVN